MIRNPFTHWSLLFGNHTPGKWWSVKDSQFTLLLSENEMFLLLFIYCILYFVFPALFQLRSVDVLLIA